MIIVVGQNNKFKDLKLGDTFTTEYANPENVWVKFAETRGVDDSNCCLVHGSCSKPFGFMGSEANVFLVTIISIEIKHL